MSPGVEILRNTFSTIAADSIKDVPQGGPMVEYQKRIASGDLVDGDSFQVVEVVLINLYLGLLP